MDGAWKDIEGTGEQAKGEARFEEFKRVSVVEGIPADVAALYRWLDVQDLEYREFSVARRAMRLDEDGNGLPDVSRGPDPAEASKRIAATPAPSVEPLASAAKPTEGADAMLPERVPAGGSARLRWRILQGHTPAAGRVAADAVLKVEDPGTKPGDAGDERRAVDVYAQARPYAARGEGGLAASGISATGAGAGLGAGAGGTDRDAQSVGGDAGTALPSWIGRYVGKAWPHKELSGEMLKTTRQRLAARWFGLRGVLQDRGEQDQPAAGSRGEVFPPMLVLFSLAGGAGKTSLAAALTRALAAQGERVLLAGLSRTDALPMYFGAVDSRPGVLRVFTPPPGVADAPVHVVSYPGAADRGRAEAGEAAREQRAEQLRQGSKGFSRVVVDVETGDEAMLQALQALGGCVLVLLVPDMNSLLTVPELKRMHGNADATGEVWQVLTRFDAGQPLHLDVREVLEQEFAETLLPLSVRHSAAVPESLAQGLTVLDYAPGEGAAQDVLQLAAWVRTLREPAREGLGQVRWSEQP